jgi:quercetin dioxygenase-like cupin family protein
METGEIKKSKSHILIEIIEYVSNSVVSRTIIKKTTGNISILAIDAGEELVEKILPFDNYIQIIDGSAEIIIDGIPNLLQTGNGIIIPAHSSNFIKANNRFKMISTIIKSGYEGNSI